MTKALRLCVVVLGPVLLALFPLLSLFAQNQTDVELSVLTRPSLTCLAGTLVLLGLLVLLTRRPAQASAVTSLLAIGFFYYGLFFEQGSTLSVLLWLAAFAALAVAALRTRRDLAAVAVVALVAGLAVTVPRVVVIVSYRSGHPSLSASDPRLWPTSLAAPAPPSGVRLPDIYVLIPDDYARPDVLRTYFHYDDSPFVKQLEDRGFTIATQSRSPYADSESNIASTLNLDYLSQFPKVLGEESEDVRPVKRVIEDNRAARLLKTAGYQYVHLDTDEVTFAGGNPGISSLAPPDAFANLWLRKSVLHRLGGRLGFSSAATDARYRDAVGDGFARLASLRSGSKPKFVVFHTLLPHDPYVYAADGSPKTFDGATDASLSSDAGRAAYLAQLIHLHTQLLNAIDQIRAHATTPPVIVLQADEGFQAEPDVFGEDAMNDIRAKGLLAVAFPGTSPVSLPEPPNTVNTLRVVLNRYLSTRYPMLPSVSYPEGDLPYDFSPIPIK